MSVINTGMQRAVELQVYKTVGNVSVSGYPHTYRLGDAFSNYTAKTNDELAKMSVADYQSRLSAFKIYIESVEPGVSVDVGSAYRQNTGSCPIG